MSDDLQNNDRDRWRLRQIEERAKEDRETSRHNFEHLSSELDSLKSELQHLRTDYDKLVSRSAGVFVAVLTIGAFIGWVINTIKDFFLKGHA